MPTRCNRGFIADLIACSTYFGHHYAHHQELKSIIQWLLPVVFRAVVFKLLVWCGAEGYVSSLQDAAAIRSAIKTSVASSWHFISTYVTADCKNYLWTMKECIVTNAKPWAFTWIRHMKFLSTDLKKKLWCSQVVTHPINYHSQGYVRAVILWEPWLLTLYGHWLSRDMNMVDFWKYQLSAQFF